MSIVSKIETALRVANLHFASVDLPGNVTSLFESQGHQVAVRFHNQPEGNELTAVQAVLETIDLSPRLPRSLPSLLEAIEQLTNPQKATLLQAAQNAAEASGNPVVRVMGALTWILTDATQRAKCVAVILREDPLFARRVAIAIDGDRTG